MFNPIIVQSCLSGLIGFRQHHTKTYDRIDDDVAASSSGMFIDNSAHSLLTVENISAVSETFKLSDVIDYDAAVTYSKGDIINSAGVIYESKTDGNNNHPPLASGANWKATNLISAYLRRLVNGASLNLFNAVFTRQKLYEVAKTLLSDTSLYDGVGNLSRRIGKLGRFVGYRIAPTFPDTMINLSWVGFQFDALNPNFKLYIYHSSQNQALKVIDLNLSKAISFEWKELADKVSLSYSSNSTNTKGYYYIGYYEADLQGQAIWKEQGFSGSSCSSCNNLDAYLYKQWGKYFSVQPIYIEAAWLGTYRVLFDEEKAIELNNQNWGMNLRLQVSCDVSDVVCRNKYVFGEALRKQVIHDLLRDMAFSMRDNQRKEKVAQMAAYALENKENHTSGVISELKDSIKAVSFDLSSMSKVCLPCEANAGMMNVKSVF